ncbi:MAG: hypothetical protein JWQ38_1742 [Flavipsychrobacter sp.]|nr:hypothetical protein [Flavipsychrobacter sp.]
MKIVQVTYTAKAEYAEQNQANIKKVMSDLQELAHPGIFYNTCVKADGKTFIHTAFFKEAENEQVLFALESFKSFQQQLKASGPEAAPVSEQLSLVAASKEIFG